VQGEEESLVRFVDRFRDRAMECHNHSTEEILVQLCIHGMTRDYRLHLINHSFCTFSELLVVARNLGKDFRPPPRSHRVESRRPVPRRYPTAAMAEGRRDGRYDNNNYNKRKRDETRAPPHFPCSMREVGAIVKRWVEDGVIKLRDPPTPPTQEEKAKDNFCIYH